MKKIFIVFFYYLVSSASAGPGAALKHNGVDLIGGPLCQATNALHHSNSYSVSAWVRWEVPVTAFDQILYRTSANANAAPYQFQIDSTKHLYSYFGAGSSTQISGVFTNWGTGTWHHVVMVVSYNGTSSTASLYHNAIQDGTNVTSAGLTQNTTSNFYFVPNCRATIDQVEIFGTNILASAVSNLYGGGSPGYAEATAYPHTLATALFRFDENSGSTFSDALNGVPGTFTNCSWTTGIVALQAETATGNNAALLVLGDLLSEEQE